MFGFFKKAKQKENFEKFTFPHLDGLYASAMNLTKNPALAEDLVQETYLKAFSAFSKLEDTTHIKAWLFRIMVNTYYNIQRKRKREILTADEDFKLIPDDHSHSIQDFQKVFTHSQSHLNSVFSDEVIHALNELPEEYRLVLILADLQDFNYQEIADILEIKIGTVMSRLFRARAAMKKHLYEFAVR